MAPIYILFFLSSDAKYSPVLIARAVIVSVGFAFFKKNNSGSIIIISSIAGLQGVENLGAYSISKTADIGLIRSLAVELGSFNINVNGLCPGIIKTDFAKALWENPNILKEIEKNAPLKRIGTADEVAGAAVLLASKSGSFITGQIITMDGGVTIAGKG